MLGDDDSHSASSGPHRDVLGHAEGQSEAAAALLMFVSPRLGALQRLVSAARPGGWLASIAPDFTTVSLSPTNLVWRRVWSQFLDAAMAGGWAPDYGVRLQGDLQAAGLVDVHADYITRCHPGGSLLSGLLSLTVERLRERMVPVGADGGEIDEARRLLEEPASTITSPTTCIARGRRLGPSGRVAPATFTTELGALSTTSYRCMSSKPAGPARM